MKFNNYIITDIVVFRVGQQIELEIVTDVLIIKNNYFPYIPMKHHSLFESNTGLNEKFDILHKEIASVFDNISKSKPVEQPANFFYY